MWNQRRWQALSTPLASIFGSGFLVIVPILTGAVGTWSPLVMLGICVLAWFVGSTVRFNIRHVEPALADSPPAATLSLERSADLALVVAYMISVCLYLHILSAFVLSGLNVDSNFNEDLLTTAIIVLITVVGITRGLDLLEELELWALVATLLIIVALVAGFAWYDFVEVGSSNWSWPKKPERTPWEVLTIVGGTLIVVQGFETTRYMGEKYSADERVESSRLAQIISTTVYVVFVGLSMPVVHLLDGQYDDNSLISMTAIAAGLLVVPLIVAALLSQFSAAVADTLAACGGLEEITHAHLQARWAYILIGMVAMALTWSADTYQVLALASRAFALYYMLQCLVALSVADSVPRRLGFGLLAATLAFVTLFSVPAG